MLRHQKLNEERGTLEDQRMTSLPKHGAEKKIWTWIPARPASKTLCYDFLAGGPWVISSTSLSF